MTGYDDCSPSNSHLVACPVPYLSTTNGVTQGDTTELRGTFLELPLFPFSKSKQEAEPGVLYIDVLRASGSRKDVFGHVTRMADGHPDMVRTIVIEVGDIEKEYSVPWYCLFHSILLFAIVSSNVIIVITIWPFLNCNCHYINFTFFFNDYAVFYDVIKRTRSM